MTDKLLSMLGRMEVVVGSAAANHQSDSRQSKLLRFFRTVCGRFAVVLNG